MSEYKWCTRLYNKFLQRFKIATISHSFLTLDCEIKAGFYKLFFYFISCLSLTEIQRRSRHELHYPFNGSVKTSVLLKNRSLWPLTSLMILIFSFQFQGNVIRCQMTVHLFSNAKDKKKQFNFFISWKSIVIFPWLCFPQSSVCLPKLKTLPHAYLVFWVRMVQEI